MQIMIDDHEMMTKIKVALPYNFDPLMFVWDNVPWGEQTLHALTSKLLKMESSMKHKQNIFAETTKSEVIYTSKPNDVNASNGASGSKQHRRTRKFSKL